MIFPIPIHTSDFLYPTFRYTLIPANKAIDIPGTHKSGFEIEIGPPFGSDVVEVIACTQPSELHKALSKHATETDGPAPCQVLTRGMAVKGIDKSVASAPEILPLTREQSRATLPIRAQSGAQSTEVLQALWDYVLSSHEIAEVLGLESRSGALKRTIKDLLENSLIERTIPDKPNSRLQKYRLTEKGRKRKLEG